MTPPAVPYAGIATRAVALALDMALVQIIVFTCGAILALVGSLVGDAQLGTIEKALAAFAWALAVGSYFVLFWTTVGQTPGMRLMALRVLAERGGHIGVLRAVVRLVGLGLAIIPLFLGFVPVLFDRRRRALPDFLAATVVVYAPVDDAADSEAPRRTAEPA